MTRRVVVFDYGSGNIRSAQRALEHVGATVEVTSDDAVALEADGVVIPGVGAFAACMSSLRKVGGDTLIAARAAHHRPLLGICVGHQVLFASGDEHGAITSGVGVWSGDVTRVHAGVLPHIGWNTVSSPETSTMFAGVRDERYYFVHSYAAHDSPYHPGNRPRTSWTSYGTDTFVAAVESDGLWSTQFHPEKSGDAGLALLRNWIHRL